MQPFERAQHVIKYVYTYRYDTLNDTLNDKEITVRFYKWMQKT